MTTRRRRRFTAGFKKRVVPEALRGDRTVQEIAARHEVHPNQVSTWKRQAVDGLDDIFANAKGSRPSEQGDHDPGPAREDRRVDGGTGFFSARVGTLSRAVRLEMVERNGMLSISRQCALLGISRSSVYYTPRGESAENLALMQRMDALSLQYPFYGSRQMARHLRREGVAVGRRRVRCLMRLMGLEEEAPSWSAGSGRACGAFSRARPAGWRRQCGVRRPSPASRATHASRSIRTPTTC